MLFGEVDSKRSAAALWGIANFKPAGLEGDPRVARGEAANGYFMRA